MLVEQFDFIYTDFGKGFYRKHHLFHRGTLLVTSNTNGRRIFQRKGFPRVQTGPFFLIFINISFSSVLKTCKLFFADVLKVYTLIRSKQDSFMAYSLDSRKNSSNFLFLI